MKEKELKTRKDIEAHIIAKAWKDEDYKQQLLTNPKAIIEQEFGVEIPEEVNIQVTEESSTSLYLVLPMYPEMEGVELSEQELEVLAGGRYRIGRTFDQVLKPGRIRRAGVAKSIASTGAYLSAGITVTVGKGVINDLNRQRK